MSANPPTGHTGARYTLPAELGGGEVEPFAAHQFRSLPEGYCWVVTVEGRVVFPAPIALLTPVKPPLPPEPPEGALVACGIGLERTNPLPVARRWADGWEFYGGGPDEHPGTWQFVVEFARRHCGADPVLLVPDPFAEPVQLPYYTSEFTLKVDGPKVQFGYRDVFRQWVTPERTRELARAAWAAANQADKAGEHE